MKVLVVIVALVVAATSCRASVEDTNAFAATPVQAEPTAAPLGPSAASDVLDGPDAVPAFIILSNPDAAAFDDAFAEAERRARRGEFVLSVDVTDCDISLALAIPRPENVVVRFFSKPVDCAVSVNYRALFLMAATGTNIYGEWTYDEAPGIEIETRELDP